MDFYRGIYEKGFIQLLFGLLPTKQWR